MRNRATLLWANTISRIVLSLAIGWAAVQMMALRHTLLDIASMVSGPVQTYSIGVLAALFS